MQVKTELVSDGRIRSISGGKWKWLAVAPLRYKGISREITFESISGPEQTLRFEANKKEKGSTST